jgi:ketosteroid isomerase-like protein
MRAAAWFTALVVAGFLPTAVMAQTDGTRAAIEAVNRKFEAAFSGKDAAALTALYTSDATVMPPNAPGATGTAAISALWAQVVPTITGTVTLNTVDVESHGAVAHERGTFVMKDASGKVIETGKYLVIWKKVDGQWKLFNDIWNGDAPGM